MINDRRPLISMNIQVKNEIIVDIHHGQKSSAKPEIITMTMNDIMLFCMGSHLYSEQCIIFHFFHRLWKQ